MEKENNFEKIINKNEVIEMLKMNGFSDPETKRIVLKWTEQQEKLVVTSKDTIIFNVDRADLYTAVGDIAGAIECLNDALYQAEQENENELAKQIFEKISNLK